ncbi:MAG TPA: hypothetical protein VJS92_11695 [Candidatus Polarisedimenticolaceae bacterium]|nr:hypothetical protein [Candidatus Polarisedimenticolaceae bacterium]
MRLCCVLLTAGAATLAAGPVRAEEPVGLMAADEAMVERLLRPRSMEQLDVEYESAKRRVAAAEQDLAEATPVAQLARARVDVKKDEIALLKARVKLARREGNADSRAQLERQLAREELSLQVFAAMREASAAQASRAEAALAFGNARLRMCAAEIELAHQRDARLAAVAPAPESGTFDAEIRQSMREALKDLRDYAKQSRRLAETTNDLAEARLDLLNTWEKYKGPDPSR